MTALTRQCEKFLLSNTPRVRSLVPVERYQLITLKPKCLQYIKTKMQATVFKADPDYNNLTMEAQNEVLMAKAVNYEAAMYRLKQIMMSSYSLYQHCTKHQSFKHECVTCYSQFCSGVYEKLNGVMKGESI